MRDPKSPPLPINLSKYIAVAVVLVILGVCITWAAWLTGEVIALKKNASQQQTALDAMWRAGK